MEWRSWPSSGVGWKRRRIERKEFGAKHAFTELDDALALDEVDAVILATPTQMHAQQAIDCMRAGKHVQVEIPLADTYQDALEVDRVQKETGLVAMCGHTRRFNPSHQWVNNKLRAGELSIQQMDVQTYFFRGKNINAEGGPRSWTDHLLWHHAAHTVDPFQYQANSRIVQVNGPRRSTPSGTRYCDGYVDPDADGEWRDLYLVPVFQ